jgi:mono/diheme cytochrome c family protein
MRRIIFLFVIVALVTVIVGCGSSAGPTETPIPTPTPFPTFAFVQPTAPGVFTQPTEAANADTVDPAKVERGRDRYVALECAECHGENGEGVEDGTSLLDYDKTETEFTDFMRSGGELGADHQYSTDRLSRSGGENLYLYLTTLSTSDE